jgi:predicted HTH transcriptional regulator
VASLANAEGGVLVIGVTDKREVIGLGDDRRQVENRLKFASDVLAEHIEYDRPIVTFHQVAVSACEVVPTDDGARATLGDPVVPSKVAKSDGKRFSTNNFKSSSASRPPAIGALLR